MEQSQKEFEKLVREYEKDIFAICFLYSQNSEEAKDLRQDTLVNLWNGLPRFNGDCSMRTWVTRIAINTCISFKRKKKVKTVNDNFMPQMCDSSATTTRQVSFLHKRLQKLDYLDRAIILLWLEDMSYAEIGAILGIPANNIGVRLVRIKDRLKNIKDYE